MLDIGEDDDDFLNEVWLQAFGCPEGINVLPVSQLSISENGKYLAFSSDSGAVGVVDLASKVITRMKNCHTNVSYVIAPPHPLDSLGSR